MSRLLLKGGRVVDPAQGLDATLDVMIADGLVEEVGPRVAPRGATVLEVKGLVVCPGFIDLHAHLREPGQEEKETIATGTRAAAAGGFTAVCAMPNTVPVNDQAGITRAMIERAKAEGVVRVYPIGAITRGQKGEELAELGDLREAGCVAFSDDGKPVASARVMRRALEYAKAFDAVLIDHCEEPTLHEKASMNEGTVATVLGLRGSPAAGEAIMVERDVLLAELIGGRVHVAHISAAASVDAVRRGKARGVRVTAEATPHHLLLTDELVRETSYDTNTKMNPPLRAEADRQAVVAGLQDGTIDCIATDHAPHAVDDKKVEYDHAAFGIVGLETAVALCLDRLVGPGLVSLPHLVALLSTNPARVLSLPGGTLAPGSPGDVTVLDLGKKRQVDPARFESRSRNTPFGGLDPQGRAGDDDRGGPRRLEGRATLALPPADYDRYHRLLEEDPAAAREQAEWLREAFVARGSHVRRASHAELHPAALREAARVGSAAGGRGARHGDGGAGGAGRLRAATPAGCARFSARRRPRPSGCRSTRDRPTSSCRGSTRSSRPTAPASSRSTPTRPPASATATAWPGSSRSSASSRPSPAKRRSLTSPRTMASFARSPRAGARRAAPAARASRSWTGPR